VTTLEPDLQRAFDESLADLPGHVLSEVRYHMLSGEARPTLKDRAPHILGAEVELAFTTGDKVYVTWQQNARRDEVFSIKTGHASSFRSDTVTSVDMSNADLWSPYIGRVNTSIEIWGDATSPYVVIFNFDGRRMFIGTSGDAHGKMYGPGEDVLLMSGEEADLREELSGLVKICEYLKA